MVDNEVYKRGEPQFNGEYDWDRIRKDILNEKDKLGISGSEMARRLKWTQGMYSMFEHGQRKRLGRETLLKVCLYFGVPHTNYLLGTREKTVKDRETGEATPEQRCWDTVKKLIYIIDKRHIGSRAEMLSVAQHLIDQVYDSIGGKE